MPGTPGGPWCFHQLSKTHCNGPSEHGVVASFQGSKSILVARVCDRQHNTDEKDQISPPLCCTFSFALIAQEERQPKVLAKPLEIPESLIPHPVRFLHSCF